VDIAELSIAGAFEMTPKIIGDSRGAFLEWFRADRFREVTGHDFTLVQANSSVSAAGTVRGVHFADVPPSQAKYVTCPAGALLDVVVDIRVGSPTFGQHEAVLLDDENRKALYVGEGLGHAFMALEDRTVIQYLCSASYAPGREHGVHPLDPALGIAWPGAGRDGRPLEKRLSDRDAAAPTLEEAGDQGLLPSLAQVEDYLSSLRG
jgi:dTDP-4-dehydrorhamnose 3,5-epimerase